MQLFRVHDLLTDTEHEVQIPARARGRTRGAKPKRRRHPQIRDGKRLAASRAFGGAVLYLEHGYSHKEAVEASGSCLPYFWAAVHVLRAGDDALRVRVITGGMALLEAGAKAKRALDLRNAYTRAELSERVAAFREIGTDRILEDLVVSN